MADGCFVYAYLASKTGVRAVLKAKAIDMMPTGVHCTNGNGGESRWNFSSLPAAW